MKMKYLIALVASALLLSACTRQTEVLLAAEENEAADNRIAVTAAIAQIGAVPILLEAVGEVQSTKAPTIGAEVSGRVTEVLVDVGDIVAKGDPLGRLDRSGILLELDVTRAEQGQVQALMSNQELEVKRLHDLAKKSFVAASAIDAAESQLRALREQIKVARARVALAEYKLSKTTITAPLSGEVDARFVSVGDYVRDGAPLFTIADTSALRLIMVFPELAMGQLRKGTALKVVTAVNPQLVFEATITEIRPQVETSNKGTVAYADLSDPGLTRAGASATVWATLEVHEDSIVVPQISLVQRPAGEVVYIIGPDHRVSERTVVSGVRLNGGIEIVTGIQPGEQIVADGAGFLSDGTLVEIRL